jgi:serine/threonine-protein kinase
MAVRDVAADSSRSSPPATASERSVASSQSRPRNPALAKKYRSLFTIGRGGMGSVEAALAIHDDAAAEKKTDYERVVALKRLLPDVAREPRRVDMFLREAKLAAMLDHPNVVRAFDFGELEGELYLAMEYVEGQPLSRLLRALAEAGEPALDPALAAYVLAEVCEGLHAAHELRGDDGKPLGLVHRDVSPQNIMIGYDGSVRLLDFGVAKIEAESQTKTGEVKGKTAYMSPEQAMGDDVDRRSDLFGVGAVLFECLALRRMWGDGTDMEVIRKLALDSPPPLEQASASAPAAMRALYTRLVAREARERPESAHQVAEELKKLVPQGSEWAARAVAAILDKHFGKQAAEQRRKLTSALEEVAPEQARELRQSVAPERTSTPSPRSVRPSEAKTITAPPSREVKAARAPLVVVGALVVAAISFGVYRTRTTATPRPEPPVIATTTTAAPPPASVAPPPPPTTEASGAPPAEATPATKPAASAKIPGKKRPPRPPGAAPTGGAPTATATATTTTTAAPTSTKPLDVDPNAIP